MAEIVVVMITCGSSDAAEEIATALLNEKLAACVNITGSVQSLFIWEGAMERQPEWLLLVKTRADRFEALRRRVEQLHSYEVPEIVALPVKRGNPAYLQWVAEVTRPEAAEG